MKDCEGGRMYLRIGTKVTKKAYSFSQLLKTDATPEWGGAAYHAGNDARDTRMALVANTHLRLSR